MKASQILTLAAVVALAAGLAIGEGVYNPITDTIQGETVNSTLEYEQVTGGSFGITIGSFVSSASGSSAAGVLYVRGGVDLYGTLDFVSVRDIETSLVLQASGTLVVGQSGSIDLSGGSLNVTGSLGGVDWVVLSGNGFTPISGYSLVLVNDQIPIIPEPASLTLLVIGGLGLMRRRRRS